MKIIVTMMFLVLISAPAWAEDQQPKETDEMAVETKARLKLEQERAKALLEKKQVTYSGFLPEVARAEKKSKFLSLRQPRNATNDVENISIDERTGRPRVFVLFRLGF